VNAILARDPVPSPVPEPPSAADIAGPPPAPIPFPEPTITPAHAQFWRAVYLTRLERGLEHDAAEQAADLALRAFVVRFVGVE
jgi:hypothetical protein